MRLPIGLAIVTAVITGVVFVQGAKAEQDVHSITLPIINVQLADGQGRETTERYCGICHSLDYITMQPHVSKAQWAAAVNKMIKVMGAPIPEKDAAVIGAYLGTAYGTGK